MGNQIDETTRVPIGWIFAIITGLVIVCSGIVGGAVLYVTDMKTEQAVTKVSVLNLDSRVTNLEGSMKETVKEIKDDLRGMREYIEKREAARRR